MTNCDATIKNYDVMVPIVMLSWREAFVTNSDAKVTIF
jgi:hypothetical protein